MGIFNQLSDQAKGMMGGQMPGQTGQGNLMGAALAMVERMGGVPALLQKLHAGGLGGKANSWIGNGQNEELSGQELRGALGDDHIQQIARETGMDPEQASAGVAQVLPQMIDHLTPDGQLPQGDMLQKGLSLLKGQFLG